MAQARRSAATAKAKSPTRTARKTTTGRSKNAHQTAASSGRAVYLIDGARTPFLRARSKPGPFTPVDLAVQCGRPLLTRQPFSPDEFDTVILGCVNVSRRDEPCAGGGAQARHGRGNDGPHGPDKLRLRHAVDRYPFRTIEAGKTDLILAGGTEALPHAPLVLRQQAVEWFGRFARAKTVWERTAT